jgi:hypothetical protein
VAKRIHPHIFRHSLATNLLLRGCDLLTIQYQLGHSDIKTTIGYIQFTPEIYRRKYDAFCPRYSEDDGEKPSAPSTAATSGPGSFEALGLAGAQEAPAAYFSSAPLKRQRQAMEYLGSRGRITNRIYMTLAHVARSTAYMDLADLCRRGLLHRQGSGRSIFYTLAHGEIRG